ncbi:unnamed protein product [Vitrella brassicaformis CCMP3155]|uniref:EGF-like domain-containing protein n=1 Tax=Vitrella brassicaformis (strain CCMP3155) TaxID=1169540 RepID=A0A0G4FX10_VITBC|nr:unnamed protein product [Vitrella brassicaformis CCMP3155]|eukprot:CEM19917.1 unnamed protein product [Vitrella brassicaformis CCMP3155]
MDDFHSSALAPHRRSAASRQLQTTGATDGLTRDVADDVLANSTMLHAYSDWFKPSAKYRNPPPTVDKGASAYVLKLRLLQKYLPFGEDRVMPGTSMRALVGSHGANETAMTEPVIHEDCTVCEEDARGPLRQFIRSLDVEMRGVKMGSFFRVCDLPFIVCVRFRTARAALPTTDEVESWAGGGDGMVDGYIMVLDPDHEAQLIFPDGGVRFPTSFYDLRGLLGVVLMNAPFNGSLSERIGEMLQLRLLYVDRSQLSGPLPDAIVSLPDLRGLYVDDTHLEGTLPPSFHTMFDRSLEALSLIRNPLGFDMHSLFHGQEANSSAPAPPHQCTTLRIARLLGESITGSLEGAFDGCESLELFHMRNTAIIGGLPALEDMHNLHTFRLENCENVTGTIPAVYGNVTSLRDFRIIKSRGIRGAIPDSINNLTDLRILSISITRVNKLPATLEGLQRLWDLDLSRNRLSGVIPAWLSRMRGLRSMRLDNNGFEDFEGDWRMPPKLEWLHVSKNSLSRIPPNWRRLETIKTLFLSDNRIGDQLTWGRHSLGLRTITSPSAHIVAEILANPPPYWPSIETLTISRNGLNTTIDEFLMPWSFQSSLVALYSLQNGLHGALTPSGVTVIDLEHVLSAGLLDRPAFQRYKRSFMAAYRLQENATSMSMVDPKASDEPVEVDDFVDDGSVVDVEKLDYSVTVADLYPDINLRAQKGFEKLAWFGVNYNEIEEIRDGWYSLPNNLQRLHIAGNRLRRMIRHTEPPEYLWYTRHNWKLLGRANLQKNPDLRIKDIRPHEGRPCSGGSTEDLYADLYGYGPLNGTDGVECTRLCHDSQILKVDNTVNEEVLCRCLPGYAGHGLNCTKCPAGSFSNREVGTQMCKQCPDDAGSDEGSAACYCRLGYEKQGNEPCEPCTAGSVGVRTGGSDGSRDTWICQDCLPGLDCSVPINYNASVLLGFFQLTVQLQSTGSSDNAPRHVTTYGAGLTVLPVVFPCPLPSSCKGTDKSNGLNICSAGHEGLTCNRCKEGFSRQTLRQLCTRCAPLWLIVIVNVLLVFAALIAIFILTALAGRAASSVRAEVPSQLIKIGLSHITAVCGLTFLVFDESLWGDQISSLVGSFFAWDGGVAQSYQIWECLLKPYVGDKCVLYRHAIWLALPLVWLTVVPLIATCFDRVRDAFRSRRRIDTDESTSFSTNAYLRALSAPPSVTNGNADTAAAHVPHQRSVTFQEDSRIEPSSQLSLAGPRKSGRWWQWLDNRGAMMVVVLTFVHPTVTRNMLALLRCRWYPYVDDVISIPPGESVSLLPTDPMDDMRPRMDLDSRVICRSAEHAPFLWIAVAGLLMWTFAPVLCGVAFLWQHRERLQDHHMRRRVGFLYVGYRKNLFYWDFVLAMRRVLVLLIAQQATAQPRQQLLGWTVVAAVCLALQLSVWPFDRGSMDILNRSEMRGLLVWLVSLFVMHFVVMLPEGTSSVLTLGLVLVVIVTNLVHYIMLTMQICRYGLLQVGYRYMAVTDRNKAFDRAVSWLIHREKKRKKRRRIAPKVFYDWSSAALSADDPPAASVGCHPSVGRPVHRVSVAMQLTHEFLWSHAFLAQSLRQKPVKARSRRQDHVVVHLPRPDDRTVTGLRHMRTRDLSHAFRFQCSEKCQLSAFEADKASSDRPGGPSVIETQPADSAVASVTSPGITLYDLQANVYYVVDELVSREQMHQTELRRRADGCDLEKVDSEASTHQQGAGGWRGLYEAFRKAKRALIENGSPPGAIPELLVSLAPTLVETPCGDVDVPISDAPSPVSSTQSRRSSSHTAAFTPPCHHLMRVDWHRLSSDEKDSVATWMMP